MLSPRPVCLTLRHANGPGPHCRPAAQTFYLSVDVPRSRYGLAAFGATDRSDMP